MRRYFTRQRRRNSKRSSEVTEALQSSSSQTTEQVFGQMWRFSLWVISALWADLISAWPLRVSLQIKFTQQLLLFTIIKMWDSDYYFRDQLSLQAHVCCEEQTVTRPQQHPTKSFSFYHMCIVCVNYRGNEEECRGEMFNIGPNTNSAFKHRTNIQNMRLHRNLNSVYLKQLCCRLIQHNAEEDNFHCVYLLCPVTFHSPLSLIDNLMSHFEFGFQLKQHC